MWHGARHLRWQSALYHTAMEIKNSREWVGTLEPQYPLMFARLAMPSKQHSSTQLTNWSASPMLPWGI